MYFFSNCEQNASQIRENIADFTLLLRIFSRRFLEEKEPDFSFSS